MTSTSHDEERNRYLQKTGIIIASLTAIITGVGILYTILSDVLPEPEVGLVPTGGIFDNQKITIDKKSDYITLKDINRRKAFESNLNGSEIFPSFDKCALNLVATNKGENEMFITDLSCNVTNIKQINEPCIISHSNSYEDFNFNSKISSENFDLYSSIIEETFSNHGWADAKNTTVNITDKDGYLENLLIEYPYVTEIGTICSGDKITLDIFRFDMFRSERIPSSGVRISPEGELSYSSLNEDVFKSQIFIDPFYLEQEKLVADGGKGAISFQEFGIFIDGNLNKMSFHKDVNVAIKPHEVIDLPIMLFANRSCIFDIEILITVNYSNTTTWAKFSGIELFVSSIYGPSIIDGELIGKGYDVYDNDIAYFPYSS